MNTTWGSLLWKEWHEHKWKLVSVTAVLWGVISIAVCFYDAEDVFAVVVGLCALCIVPLAFFVGLGAAAGERGNKTLAFLQALPTPMWRVATVKLVLGLATVIIPVVFTMALGAAWLGTVSLLNVDYQHELRLLETDTTTGKWYLDGLLVGATLGTSIFIWAAASGVNRKDEVMAGGFAAATMLGCWLIVFLIVFVMFPDFTEPASSDVRTLLNAAMALAPGGIIPATINALEVEKVSIWAVVISAALMHALLTATYVWRFGRNAQSDVQSPRQSVHARSVPNWLPAPRVSPLAAIVWKQARESGPLVVAGTMVVLAFVALTSANQLTVPRDQWDHLGRQITHGTAMLGTVLAMLLGVGVAIQDVRPGINTFWRSRPINPDQWFWVKFLTGLGILAGALYLPVVVIALVITNDPVGALLHPEVAIGVAVQLAIYAAAVAMTNLVRQPVYAAILSIATVYALVVLGLCVLSVIDGLRTGVWDWYFGMMNEPTETQLVIVLLSGFVISAVVGWIATRRDWGRAGVR